MKIKLWMLLCGVINLEAPSLSAVNIFEILTPEEYPKRSHPVKLTGILNVQTITTKAGPIFHGEVLGPFQCIPITYDVSIECTFNPIRQEDYDSTIETAFNSAANFIDISFPSNIPPSIAHDIAESLTPYYSVNNLPPLPPGGRYFAELLSPNNHLYWGILELCMVESIEEFRAGLEKTVTAVFEEVVQKALKKT